MDTLFVGNSHTYLNGLPYQVQVMMHAAQVADRYRAWMCATRGKSLAWHADEVPTLLNLTCRRWDQVVLQQVTHPFDGYEALSASVARLASLVRGTGAELLLFVTWKYRDGPESDQDSLNEAFAQVAQEQNARLVPVGNAWRLARARHPKIQLYAPDGGACHSGRNLPGCVCIHRLPSSRAFPAASIPDCRRQYRAGGSA